MSDFNPSQCTHVKTELRYRPDVNGNPRYQYQCLACGSPVGNFVSIMAVRKLMALNKVAAFDNGLEEGVRRRFGEKLQRDEDTARFEWWRWYNGYLQTPEWRAKRDLVMLRARRTCEGCGLAAATQVHHLSYKHVGNEFLWELVAVCDACHDRAHTDEEKR